MNLLGGVAKALHSAQGRVLAGLSLVALTVWLCEPTITGVWNWEAVAAFTVALAAWLFGCLPNVSTLSTHDRQLFERFNQTFPSHERQFIRNHNFGASFELRCLDGVRAVSGIWEGAEYEFDEPGLKAKFSALLADIEAFSGYVALNTHTLPNAPEWASVLTDHDRMHGVSPETQQKIKKMNDDATRLIETADAFTRNARTRM